MSQIEFAPQGPGPNPHELVLVDLPEVSVAITFEEVPTPAVHVSEPEPVTNLDYPHLSAEATAAPAADMLDWFDTNKLPVDLPVHPDDYELAA